MSSTGHVEVENPGDLLVFLINLISLIKYH